MNYDEIAIKLAQRLTGKRFKHSVGVSETAAVLAKQFGGDVAKSQLAGILHDCAREIPKSLLLQRAVAFGIVVDDVECYEPVLLHAPLGAKLAQIEYGIEDEDVCRAIALHTTGAPEMTLLDKIIYVADCIEPGRSFPGVDKLRHLSKTNLEIALLAAYNHTLQYIIDEGGLIHPATVNGRNSLLITLRK